MRGKHGGCHAPGGSRRPTPPRIQYFRGFSGTSAGDSGRHSGTHTRPGCVRVKPSNSPAICSRLRIRNVVSTRATSRRPGRYSPWSCRFLAVPTPARQSSQLPFWRLCAHPSDHRSLPPIVRPRLGMHDRWLVWLTCDHEVTRLVKIGNAVSCRVCRPVGTAVGYPSERPGRGRLTFLARRRVIAAA
jgi:hypothetical protein